MRQLCCIRIKDNEVKTSGKCLSIIVKGVELGRKALFGKVETDPMLTLTVTSTGKNECV